MAKSFFASRHHRSSGKLSRFHWGRAIFSRFLKKGRRKDHFGEKTLEVINKNRRDFLKWAVFGGVVFAAGKYFNPFLNMLRGETVIDEKVFKNFTITETGKQLRVTDNDGGDLLVIDKEGF